MVLQDGSGSDKNRIIQDEFTLEADPDIDENTFQKTSKLTAQVNVVGETSSYTFWSSVNTGQQLLYTRVICIIL